MMNAEDKNLQSILKHIDNVRFNCVLLGNKIIEDGNLQLGKALISNGYKHDNSKLHGIELLFLNEKTKEENPELFNAAYFQHISTNKHHPEAWVGGIDSMDELHLLEMVCDWDSRSFEFNTNSMDWFKDVGADKYKIKPNSRLYKFIHKHLLFLHNYIEGQKFNLLTVVDCSDGMNVECICDCGNEVTCKRYELRSGKIKSCGCLKSLQKGEFSPCWTGFGQISGKKWNQIKVSAERRDIDFSLTIEDAWELFEKQKGLCALSGEEISLIHTEEKPRASLDRIDPSLGYDKGNVQWVHPSVNYMKHILSQDEFIRWCHKISTFNKVNESV